MFNVQDPSTAARFRRAGALIVYGAIAVGVVAVVVAAGVLAWWFA